MTLNITPVTPAGKRKENGHSYGGAKKREQGEGFAAVLGRYQPGGPPPVARPRRDGFGGGALFRELEQSDIPGLWQQIRRTNAEISRLLS